MSPDFVGALRNDPGRPCEMDAVCPIDKEIATLSLDLHARTNPSMVVRSHGCTQGSGTGTERGSHTAFPESNLERGLGIHVVNDFDERHVRSMQKARMSAQTGSQCRPVEVERVNTPNALRVPDVHQRDLVAIPARFQVQLVFDHTALVNGGPHPELVLRMLLPSTHKFPWASTSTDDEPCRQSLPERQVRSYAAGSIA